MDQTECTYRPGAKFNTGGTIFKLKGANMTWKREDQSSAFAEGEMVPFWKPEWEEDLLRRKAGGTPGH